MTSEDLIVKEDSTSIKIRWKQILSLLASYANISTNVALISFDPNTAPIAPFISSTLQATIIDVGTEIIDRNLTKKEKQRASVSMLFAILRISERLEKGDHFKNKILFEQESNELNDAKKLLEATLIESRDQYEEQKLEYLGYLYANLLFTADHDFNRCLYFLKIAEGLNYRQYCYISLLNNKEKFGLNRKVELSDSYKVMSIDQRSELHEMIQKRIINGPEEFRPKVFLPLEWYNTDWVGEQLYTLMQLDKISEAELIRLK